LLRDSATAEWEKEEGKEKVTIDDVSGCGMKGGGEGWSSSRSICGYLRRKKGGGPDRLGNYVFTERGRGGKKFMTCSDGKRN